jgi:hypothetical protein
VADDRTVNERSIEDLTLKDLFTLPPGSLSDPELAAGVDAEDFRALRKQLAAQPGPIAWSLVQSEMAEVLSATLNDSMLSMWARAWAKYQRLMDDVERSRKSPDAVILSPLAEHSVDSTLHPYLEIFWGPKKIQKISFDVTLTTRFKGLILGLRKAQIMSLQLGECDWTGTIRIKDVTLFRRELRTLTLPGRIELRRGVSLGGPARG